MAVLATQIGTLGTFTGNGQTSSDTLMGDGCEVIYFLYTSTGAATNTLALEQSLDNGTTWITVTNANHGFVGAATTSSQSPATGSPVSFGLVYPVGLYRAKSTAHNAGTHTVQWRKGFRA